MLRKKIVSTLIEIRKEQKISQEKLAEASGLDRTYISGVERMTRNFTVDSLEKIIMGLNISLDEFLEKLTR